MKGDSFYPVSINKVSATYTTLAGDTNGVVQAMSGTFIITINASLLVDGDVITIQNYGSGIITVGTSAGTIGPLGETTAILYQGDSLDLLFDGTNFSVL